MPPAIMQDKGIRRLLVLDANHRLVGVRSLDDLAARLPAPQLAGETLAKIAAKRVVVA